MKTRSRISGATLVELLITVGVVGVAGSAFYWILATIVMLGARNTAVNVAHQEGREMLNHAVSDLHNTISIPQLIDSSLASVSGNGPAAGVSYQILVGGPGTIASSAAAGQPVVVISMPAMTALATPTIAATAPAAGMHLLIPGFQVESDIVSVSGASSPYTITLAQNLTTAIDTTLGNYQCYYSERRALVVANSTLKYYSDLTNRVVYRIDSNVTSATPFSIPGGNNQYIQASITTTEPNSTARGYKNLNFEATITVPYRYRLTTYP